MVVAVDDWLYLALLEIGQDVHQRVLSLRQAHNPRVMAATTERSKGQLFNIVVLIEARGAQSLFQLFEFGRQHTCFEIHRSWRVLHGVVVNDNQLLNVFGNRGARVLSKLSGSGGERPRKKEGG